MASSALDRQSVRHEVLSMLRELGDTPDQVVDSLYNLGVRGHRFSITDCPVARYTNAVLSFDPDVGRVKVGLRRLAVRSARRSRCSVVMPPPVRQVVRSFDDGLYPELLASPINLPLIDLPPPSSIGIKGWFSA
jgi:hypothetical protein